MEKCTNKTYKYYTRLLVYNNEYLISILVYNIKINFFFVSERYDSVRGIFWFSVLHNVLNFFLIPKLLYIFQFIQP